MYQDVIELLDEALPEPMLGRIYLKSRDFLGELECRLDTDEALQHVQVSDTVAKECTQEMAEGQKTGWKF